MGHRWSSELEATDCEDLALPGCGQPLSAGSLSTISSLPAVHTCMCTRSEDSPAMLGWLYVLAAVGAGVEKPVLGAGVLLLDAV